MSSAMMMMMMDGKVASRGSRAVPRKLCAFCKLEEGWWTSSVSRRRCFGSAFAGRKT